MTKTEYWQSVRSNCRSSREAHSQVRVRLDEDQLAQYAYNYWQANGSLPSDYMPDKDKEESGDVLRCLWSIAERANGFTDAVIGAYLNHFNRNDEDTWYHVRISDYLIFKQVKDQRLRPLLLEILGKSYQFKQGLMAICSEHVMIAYRASVEGGYDSEGSKILLANTDLISFIKETDWPTNVLEQVIDCFTGHLRDSRSRTDLNEGQFEKEIEIFNTTVRPVLIGKLMVKAVSFDSWCKIFDFVTNPVEEAFALHHMYRKAKSLRQLTRLYFAASDEDFKTITVAVCERWRSVCLGMTPEQLALLEDSEVIDRSFVQETILAKCQD